MTEERIADLRARLALLDELEAGPHAGVPVIAQDIAQARAYIEALLQAAQRGDEAFELAVTEDRPGRLLGALAAGGEHFRDVRSHLLILPDDEHPEQVWIRWDPVPVDLRDDVVSLASHYRDVVVGRKIGRPKKRTVS